MGIVEHGIYQDIENISLGTIEMYYLDYIKTSTHTAVFVKNIRLDEHSKPTNGASPKAALKLDRIILIRNENFNLFSNSAALNYPGLVSGNQNGVIHIGHYNANASNINNKTLASVEFAQNYNLCKNYHANIQSNIGKTSHTLNLSASNSGDSDSFVYEKTTTASGSNNGKLSLTEITTYGFGRNKETPSYQFEYGTGTSSNPDFHPNAKDYWGYYKSDFDPNISQSLYVSTTSKEGVDAWSMTKITTPLGGTIEIEYEADQYHKVGYSEKIHRVFKAEAVQTSTNPNRWNIIIEDDAFDDFFNGEGVLGVGFSFPIVCDYSDYLYSPNSGSNVTYLSNAFNSSRSAGFNMDEVNQISYNATTNTVSNLDLTYDCGYDSNGNAGVLTHPSKRKAIASIALSTVYGGGTRVKFITSTRSDNTGTSTNYKTEYIYSGGVASQEPDRFTPAFYQGRSKNSILYNRHEFPPSVGYSNVMVKGKGVDNRDADNYSSYDFINYDDFNFHSGTTIFYGKEKEKLNTNYDTYFNQYETSGTPPNIGLVFSVESIKQSRNITAFDRSRIDIGKVKKQATFDKNGQLIASTENVYETISSTAEVFHQRTHAEVPITYDPNYIQNNTLQDRWDKGAYGPFTSPFSKPYASILNSNAFFSKRYENQVLKKQIVHKDGATYITEFVAFDELTGYPKIIERTDPVTGAVVRVERTYAHEVYPEMGPKSESFNNKNLLGAVTLEKVYKDDVLVDGYKQTYSKYINEINTNAPFIVNGIELSYYSTGAYSSDTWRPQALYIQKGETFSEETTRKLEYISFIDKDKGHVLERIYPGGRFSSVKYGYDNQFVIAELANGRYADFAFSGAEEFEPGLNNMIASGVAQGDASVNTNLNYVHTGKKSLVVSNGTAFKYNGFLPGRQSHQAKVWVRSSDGTMPNVSLAFKVYTDVYDGTNHDIYSELITSSNEDILQVGNWYLLTRQLQNTLSGGRNTNHYLEIICTNNGNSPVYFDDFRFEPVDSPITCYVYDEDKGTLEWILGPENFYERIEYNNLGQPYRTYRETLNGEKLVTETTRGYYRDYITTQ